MKNNQNAKFLFPCAMKIVIKQYKQNNAIPITKSAFPIQFMQQQNRKIIITYKRLF